jgi:crotonobetainyl-CoA:carnitine CoA-transferase CaiB-like acyl-CoA transferase
VRICDFTGQLAGAGATKILAAFGAQVIRIEDPVTGGLWDILRSLGPYLDERRDRDVGGAFNNHNVEKLGITLNLRTERGRELFRELVKRCDVVTENFAAGVLARRGFAYPDLRAINEKIIYVSNCGFGHVGPYRDFKSWGPVVQAVCGLTFTSGLPGLPPAGWGFSYMDHGGAYFMAIAILMALIHRSRTGEGQWVDMSCTEAGATLNGPAMLDYTVNGRRMRREGSPDSNRAQFDEMAPHGVYPALGDDAWIAIACRDDRDWRSLAGAVGKPTWADRYASLPERLRARLEIDAELSQWTRSREASVGAEALQKTGVPAAAVQRPEQRIDQDRNTEAWGLWPTVLHSAMGKVRVEGLPIHLSRTDWRIERGAPCLGEHNERVYGELLGLSADDIRSLREEGTL